MAFARIIAFTLLAAAPALSFASNASAATPQTQAAAAKVSIKATVEHDGSKLATSGTSRLGETAKLRAADDDHAHDLSLTIVSKGDSGYAVKIGYKRDGKRVVKAKTVDASDGAVSFEAGGSKITISLAPAKKKRARIEVPEGDDPLAGL